MKKLFISQPMRGKSEEEILAERKRILEKAEAALGEPCEVIESYEPSLAGKDENVNKPVWALGYSLSYLAFADVAAFGKGWEDARGCRIEHQVCLDYGIDIVEIYSD